MRGGRDSNRLTSSRETPEKADDLAPPVPAQSSPASDRSAHSQAEPITVDTLRSALGDAIRDRAWRVVEIIQGQIDEAERATLPANVRVLRPTEKKK